MQEPGNAATRGHYFCLWVNCQVVLGYGPTPSVLLSERGQLYQVASMVRWQAAPARPAAARPVEQSLPVVVEGLAAPIYVAPPVGDLGGSLCLHELSAAHWCPVRPLRGRYPVV